MADSENPVKTPVEFPPGHKAALEEVDKLLQEKADLSDKCGGRICPALSVIRTAHYKARLDLGHAVTRQHRLAIMAAESKVTDTSRARYLDTIMNRAVAGDISRASADAAIAASSARLDYCEGPDRATWSDRIAQAAEKTQAARDSITQLEELYDTMCPRPRGSSLRGVAIAIRHTFNRITGEACPGSTTPFGCDSPSFSQAFGAALDQGLITLAPSDERIDPRPNNT